MKHLQEKVLTHLCDNPNLHLVNHTVKHARIQKFREISVGSAAVFIQYDVFQKCAKGNCKYAVFKYNMQCFNLKAAYMFDFNRNLTAPPFSHSFFNPKIT